MSRTVFVGLSAGALAAGGSMTRPLADEPALGAPHPPLVAEDDPAIDVLRPDLNSDGTAIAAYAAMPRETSAGTPGVVVVQHVWGVDAQIRDVVRRLAKNGYLAVAPDLYARSHAPSGDGVTDYTIFRPFSQALVADQVDSDIRSACTWIRARAGKGPSDRPPKVGVTGFCMGGAIALRVASDSPQFDAAAIWYGKVRQAPADPNAPPDAALAYIDTIKIPVCGNYGGRDTSIPVDDVRELQHRLTVPNDIKIYPEAGHAFFDDTRPSYVASAAADAWARTLAWFTKYLQA